MVSVVELPEQIELVPVIDVGLTGGAVTDATTAVLTADMHPSIVVEPT